MQFEAKKLYYKIGEVCKIVGVPAHVLRFWETQFPMLSPPKSKSGQRIYRPRDIELLLEIRRLLYDEGFTIAGARKRIGARARNERQESGGEKAPASGASGESSGSGPEPLSKVKSELEKILTLLDGK